MRFFPATADSTVLDRAAAYPADGPVTALTAERIREELGANQFRPEWVWLAEDENGHVLARALWWGRADSEPPMRSIVSRFAPPSPIRSPSPPGSPVPGGPYAVSNAGSELKPGAYKLPAACGPRYKDGATLRLRGFPVGHCHRGEAKDDFVVFANTPLRLHCEEQTIQALESKEVDRSQISSLCTDRPFGHPT